MRVGFVRSVKLGVAAIAAFGLAACDDSPTDFETTETVAITTNPSVMILGAGLTQILESRAVNQGNAPTWEDVDAMIDPSCASTTPAGEISVAISESYEGDDDTHPVRPPGVFDVTGLTTLGETCIQLSAGGVSATVAVTVVADSLEILNAPASGELVVFETVQLSADLLSDSGESVGPFDPLTDVVWSSDDESVLSVDQTGLVTGEGAGTATITATWSESGRTVTASTTITVTVPPPALTSTDAASYTFGDVVTVTGTGLIPGAHSVFVNGLEVTGDVMEVEIVDETTATFRMPGSATGETVDIQVGVVGALSNAVQADRVPTGDEPANDATATAPMVTFPVDRWGFVQAGAFADIEFYEFTLAAETTISLFLDWDTSADLDLYVTDAAFAFALCSFVTATAAHPEQGECTLAPGTYWLAVASYDGSPATWRMMVDVVVP